jgi:hypothetical protein
MEIKHVHEFKKSAIRKCAIKAGAAQGLKMWLGTRYGEHER